MFFLIPPVGVKELQGVIIGSTLLNSRRPSYATFWPPVQEKMSYPRESDSWNVPVYQVVSDEGGFRPLQFLELHYAEILIIQVHIQHLRLS